MGPISKRINLTTIIIALAILFSGMHVSADVKIDLKTAAFAGLTEKVNSLIKDGANVNEKDKSGETALMAAALMGNTEIVIRLLEHGADVNAKDMNGETALMAAAFTGRA
ncbi:MAG: ankyrin repeat domain-containing protein, partial [Nitrospiraceae bacterium]